MGIPEINLATLIQDQADANPDAVAVVDGTLEVPFHDFSMAINDLARALAAEGIGPSMEVGIDVAKPYDHWLAILAVARLGGVSITVLDRGGMERAQQVDLDLILSTNPSSGLKTAAKKFIYADGAWIENVLREAENIALPDPELAARSLGRIVFSSGTTGTPKGILVAAELWAHSARGHSELIGAGARLYDGYGIEGMQTYALASWWKGGAVILNYDFSGRREDFARAVTKSTFINASSATLGGILGTFPGVFQGREDRVIKVGGATLPLRLRDEALARLCRRIEITYSSMETFNMARGDSLLLDRHPGAVGFAVEGAEVQIVDENGQETPAGVEGEIRARTPFMATGYLDNAQATAQFFRDGWFCPGDRAFKEADGLIVITGRESDVLNLSGAKFSASEIENQVRQVAMVVDVCALAMPAKTGLNILAIPVVLGKGAALEAVRSEVAHRLAGIEIANFVLVPVKEIPRNPRGKVSRPELVTWLQNQPGFGGLESQRGRGFGQ